MCYFQLIKIGKLFKKFILIGSCVYPVVKSIANNLILQILN